MADAQAGAAGGGAPAAPPPEAIDLEALLAPYAAPARVDRLLWIAEQFAGTPLELEALRMAGDDVKKVSCHRKWDMPSGSRPSRRRRRC